VERAADESMGERKKKGRRGGGGGGGGDKNLRVQNQGSSCGFDFA